MICLVWQFVPSSLLSPCWWRLLPSADNLCKQFGSRPGPTFCRSWSGAILFDTLIVFLKEFFEKVNFEKSQQTTIKVKNYPACKEWRCWCADLWRSCLLWLCDFSGWVEIEDRKVIIKLQQKIFVTVIVKPGVNIACCIKLLKTPIWNISYNYHTFTRVRPFSLLKHNFI